MAQKKRTRKRVLDHRPQLEENPSRLLRQFVHLAKIRLRTREPALTISNRLGLVDFQLAIARDRRCTSGRRVVIIAISMSSTNSQNFPARASSRRSSLSTGARPNANRVRECRLRACSVIACRLNVTHPESDQAPRLVFGRHPAIRRELVQRHRQFACQPEQQLLARKSGVLGERIQHTRGRSFARAGPD